MSRFVKGQEGTTTVEYLVVAALVVGVLGSALLGLFTALQGKIVALNNGL
jgi:Flp pilus assembly pilin Flp